tara:strand:+ start:2820 stop:3428 length:609 start_codon:yes stop_codon:yes gene_type:complete
MQIRDNLLAFPSVISSYILDVDNKKMLKLFKSLHYIKTNATKEGMSKSYSSKSMFLLNNLPELQKECNSALKDYVHNTLQQDVIFKYTCSWATKVAPKGFCQQHNHQNSWISGVYYPQGHQSFKIRFYNPLDHFWKLNPKKHNLENASSFMFTAQNNLLLIFPSYLKHEIIYNDSKQNRYSLAFNIFPSGTLGSGDSEIHLS